MHGKGLDGRNMYDSYDTLVIIMIITVTAVTIMMIRMLGLVRKDEHKAPDVADLPHQWN